MRSPLVAPTPLPVFILFAAPLAAEAQPAGKTYRIGLGPEPDAGRGRGRTRNGDCALARAGRAWPRLRKGL